MVKSVGMSMRRLGLGIECRDFDAQNHSGLRMPRVADDNDMDTYPDFGRDKNRLMNPNVAIGK
jgi:hypothetical protein